MPDSLTSPPNAPPSTTTRRLPAVVWATAWVSYFTDFSTELIYAILPAFYQTVLHLGSVWLGVIEGFAEAIASLSKLFSGHWSDRTGGRKWWMVCGYTLSTLAKPLLATAGSAYAVMGLRGADRVGKGLRGAPRDALLAAYLIPEQRGMAFSVQRALDHAGALTGSLCAFLLLKFGFIHLTGLFWLTLIPGAIAVLIIVLFIHDRPRKQDVRAVWQQVEAHAAADHTGLWASLAQQSTAMKRYLAVLGVFALGNSTDALLLARAEDQMQAGGLSAADATAWLLLLWAWLHVTKSLSSPLGGWISDRVGRALPVIIGWLIYAAVYVGFAFWSGLAAPWVLFGIYGLYYGMVEGTERALVTDLEANADRRGTAFGAYYFVTGIAALPASAMCGWLWWKYGHQAAFMTGAALALLAALLLPWALRPHLAERKKGKRPLC